MISFLKTVLIILLVYLGVKYLLRWLTPYIMRFIAKKAAQRFENAFGQHPFGDPSAGTKDEATLERDGQKPKSNGNVVGEYVDFEEID